MIAYILVTAPIKDNMTELWLNSCPICNISSWFFISFTSYTWSLAAVQIYLAKSNERSFQWKIKTGLQGCNLCFLMLGCGLLVKQINELFGFKL